MCACNPSIKTPCCGKDSCHDAAKTTTALCPWCTHAHKAQRESLEVAHARKQGAADGFQQGWHAALQRVHEGDIHVNDLVKLVPVPLTCTWSLDDVGGDSTWEAQCGGAFEFNDGGPLSNGMRFCGRCGKLLTEHRTSDGGAEQ